MLMPGSGAEVTYTAGSGRAGDVGVLFTVVGCGEAQATNSSKQIKKLNFRTGFKGSPYYFLSNGWMIKGHRCASLNSTSFLVSRPSTRDSADAADFSMRLQDDKC
jgi:hypothetical protein